MNNTQQPNNKSMLGSHLTSIFFVIAGVVTFYDTQSYGDVDSKVFPQAAAIVLIICASISLIMGFLKPLDEQGFGRGTWWRRFLLVITMLLTCVAMPYIGFLAAGTIAFAGGLIAGMHDSWTPRTLLIYWGSGVFIMVAFYVLFRFALHVPLP